MGDSGYAFEQADGGVARVGVCTVSRDAKARGAVSIQWEVLLAEADTIKQPNLTLKKS